MNLNLLTQGDAGGEVFHYSLLLVILQLNVQASFSSVKFSDSVNTDIYFNNIRLYSIKLVFVEIGYNRGI
jgi:hypothetical protein